MDKAVFKPIAQRSINAERAFVAVLMDRAGINEADAIKAMETMLRLKVAKMDWINGEIRVKHGAFLERDVILNAVAY